MPSQISTRAATTAAEEKLKIAARSWRPCCGSACWATASVSAARRCRNGSLGCLFDALGEGQQALFELRDSCALGLARGVAAIETDHGDDQRRRRWQTPVRGTGTRARRSRWGWRRRTGWRPAPPRRSAPGPAPAVTAMPRVSASKRSRRSMAPKYSLKRSKGFMPPLYPPKDVDSPATIRPLPAAAPPASRTTTATTASVRLRRPPPAAALPVGCILP